MYVAFVVQFIQGRVLESLLIFAGVVQPIWTIALIPQRTKSHLIMLFRCRQLVNIPLAFRYREVFLTLGDGGVTGAVLVWLRMVVMPEPARGPLNRVPLNVYLREIIGGADLLNAVAQGTPGSTISCFDCVEFGRCDGVNVGFGGSVARVGYWRGEGCGIGECLTLTPVVLSARDDSGRVSRILRSVLFVKLRVVVRSFVTCILNGLVSVVVQRFHVNLFLLILGHIPRHLGSIARNVPDAVGDTASQSGFLQLGGIALYLSNLHNVPPADCLHRVDGLEGVEHAVCFELYVLGRVYILHIQFIVPNIRHFVLLELLGARFVNVAVVHVVSSHNKFLFAVCVRNSPWNIGNV